MPSYLEYQSLEIQKLVSSLVYFTVFVPVKQSDKRSLDFGPEKNNILGLTSPGLTCITVIKKNPC